MSQDRKLVDRVLSGDRSAFNELFESQFSRLYRFALVRVDYDEDAAHDVAQTALCTAIRKLESYRGEAPLFSWLCTFCRRELWARSKSHSTADLIEDSPEIRAALDSLTADEETNPEVSYRQKETARLVRVALDRLPTRYGDLLERKYIQGQSVREIASQLDLGQKAAESMLTRARAAFRDAFSAMVRESAIRANNPIVPEAGGTS